LINYEFIPKHCCYKIPPWSMHIMGNWTQCHSLQKIPTHVSIFQIPKLTHVGLCEWTDFYQADCQHFTVNCQLISQLSWLDACDYDMIAKRTCVRSAFIRILQISIYFRFDSCAVPRLMSWANLVGTSSLPALLLKGFFLRQTVCAYKQ